MVLSKDKLHKPFEGHRCAFAIKWNDIEKGKGQNEQMTVIFYSTSLFPSEAECSYPEQ